MPFVKHRFSRPSFQNHLQFYGHIGYNPLLFLILSGLQIALRAWPSFIDCAFLNSVNPGQKPSMELLTRSDLAYASAKTWRPSAVASVVTQPTTPAHHPTKKTEQHYCHSV